MMIILFKKRAKRGLLSFLKKVGKIIVEAYIQRLSYLEDGIIVF